MTTPGIPARASSERPIDRRPEVLAWLIVAGAVLAFLWDCPYAHIDDAYIAYRYARNLAQGHGLVFNVGEHVEGFTSLAWVLLVAGGMKFGSDAPAVSRALGMMSGALLLALSYVYAGMGLEPRRKWVAALTPWLLLSTTSFGYWATSGLETPLLCVAGLLSLILMAKGRPLAAVIVGLFGTLVRPEGVFILVLVLAAHVHRQSVRKPSTRVLFALSGALLAVLTLFRLRYFGAPLPNTFYAKTGSIPFVATIYYALGFFIETLAPVALPAALGAATQRVFWLGAAWVGVTFVYVLMEGADVFEHFRFFLPAVAPLLAMSTRGALSAWGDQRAFSRLAVSCIPVAFLWYFCGPVPGILAFAAAAVSTVALPRALGYVPRVGGPQWRQC